MKQLAIGIDIGGTSSKFGFTDREGNIIKQTRMATQDFKGSQEFIRGLKERLEDMHTLDHVVGIGVGAPNGNFYNGTIEEPPNLPWKGISPFAQEIEEALGIKCVVTNDANAAALGEMVYGRAQNMRDIVVLTIGTGLGCGIISNGELVYGKHGLAGELGHTLVNPNGRVCGCGKRGCLETYVSATGIRRTVYKLLADHTDASILRSVSFDKLSTTAITDAAMEGDKIAIEAFRYTGRILGMKAADFVIHTDPEAIFLLGGLAKAGKYLFEPAQEYMESNLMPLFKDRGIELIPSGLKDDDAPILGASSLVWKYLDGC